MAGGTYLPVPVCHTFQTQIAVFVIKSTILPAQFLFHETVDAH